MLVDFWSNHFSIYAGLRTTRYTKTDDDRHALRPNALGAFRDLLWASAHSPAMLAYLDQATSTREAPNENYARELLELHTVGVEGGYTQRDVEAVARALTGWSLVGPRERRSGNEVEGELPGLLAQLAGGLAALYHDLGDRAKRVTIVTMSEFGRRVPENGSAGTDHGHGNSMFVLGGGVNGGKVYGEWPTLAPEALADPGDLAITTDFRDVLGEIVQKRLANPKLAEVFPGYTDWKMRGVVRGSATA
jgi:uncharacterized protein (DUF1501 family)